jgi:ERF superfamily
MQTSEAINELTAALAKAQGEITGALKESKNPFYKSSYADLASCWDACRGPLSKNSLAVFQAAETTEHGLVLTTTLAHGSGQWMRSTLGVNPKDDTPQSMGSALTYARRYALTAMVGIAQVDDDGNAASGRPVNGAHDPRGDMGKDTPIADVVKAAAQMRDIMDMDVEEPIKALKVLDYHDVLNRDQDLYVRAADELGSKLKGAWKAYVAQAKSAQKADSMASNGKRAF